MTYLSLALNALFGIALLLMWLAWLDQRRRYEVERITSQHHRQRADEAERDRNIRCMRVEDEWAEYIGEK